MSELLTEKQAILFPMVQQSSVGVVIQYISYFLLGIGFLPEMAWLSLASSPFVLFFSPVLVLITILLILLLVSCGRKRLLGLVIVCAWLDFLYILDIHGNFWRNSFDSFIPCFCFSNWIRSLIIYSLNEFLIEYKTILSYL